MSNVLVSLSGGMDSATLLGYMVHCGNCVRAVSFLYGSKHNKWELKAADSLAQHYGIEHDVIDLRSIFKDIQSNLMKTGGEIPEGHYNDATMSQTVVPGRNHIFAAVLAAIAESNCMDEICLAVHSGDHHIYPDCRPEFIRHLNKAVYAQTEGKVVVFTPFIHDDKTKILTLGHKIGVPYNLTRTCYKDQPVSCGKCGSCTERLEAWQNIDKKDPIQYM